MPSLRWGWVGLRLRGESGLSGWSSAALDLPEALPADVADSSRRGAVYNSVFATDEDAKVRAWALLAGPVLRMHAQPAFTHSGSSKRQKLLNLCWNMLNQFRTWKGQVRGLNLWPPWWGPSYPSLSGGCRYPGGEAAQSGVETDADQKRPARRENRTRQVSHGSARERTSATNSQSGA